ncbi:MAG: site-2 protease family protein [Phycisphaerales bacterium]|nr:site-2 protease family protein [Phycisphaerales bacterium]
MPLASSTPLLLADWIEWLQSAGGLFQVILGFSIIIFFHELGHFLAAKWVGVRVHRFAVGFGPRLFGFRPGEGFTFGSRPDYSAEELEKKRYGETDYCMNLLPIGGYVKMLGHDDILVNEETGDIKLTTDPRAFNNRPVGQRAIVVSAGVIFNLLLAALLIIIVFMVGWKTLPPIIGIVAPTGPAYGKLQPGDRILAIDGAKADSFQDLIYAGYFAKADKAMRLAVERDGKPLPETIDIIPDIDDRLGFGQIGVSPAFSNKRARDGFAVGDAENVKAGDTIVAVDGAAVSDGLSIWQKFRDSGGRVLKLLVRRPDPSAPGGYREIECLQRASLVFDLYDLAGERPSEQSVDNRHLLGFQRRRLVNTVHAGWPAEAAGFKAGDVIVDWAGRPSPTFAEIVAANRASDGQALKATVLRDGKAITLEVTPKVSFTMVGDAPPPRVGLEFAYGGEENMPVVADIAPDTPAAAMNIPRGSLILSIDGKPVKDWFEVAEALMASAGREIVVRYRTGGDEVDGRLKVPSSFIDALGLPNTISVASINGKAELETEVRGRTSKFVLFNNPAAIRKMLSKHVGETVRIRYQRSIHSSVEEVEFSVREDNLDPWQMRIRYDYEPMFFEPATSILRTNNPIEAAGMGVREVKRMVETMYVSLSKLATRDASVENVSGPVGIVRMGVEQARVGISELLIFLAIISVNLAVINFLPIPVMDGGLMLFLLIEKIKGRPLSLKTQMYTTLVGLAAIILIGIFVTIQDVGRWLF